jgi:hypothetical protein
LRVEASEIKTEPSAQSNMGITIGKEKVKLLPWLVEEAKKGTENGSNMMIC